MNFFSKQTFLVLMNSNFIIFIFFHLIVLFIKNTLKLTIVRERPHRRFLEAQLGIDTQPSSDVIFIELKLICRLRKDPRLLNLQRCGVDLKSSPGTFFFFFLYKTHKYFLNPPMFKGHFSAPQFFFTIFQYLVCIYLVLLLI